MPSSNPLDPSNALTVTADPSIRWHGGNGTITYTFLTFVPDSYPEIDADTWDVGGLAVPKTDTVGLDARQEALVARAVAAYNEVASLHISYVAGGADIEIGAYAFDDPDLFGFAYYPGTSGIEGDVWLNNAMPIVEAPTLGDEGWVTILHEFGHALGLKHPFEDTPLLATALDSNRYTVMSYDPHPASAGIWPVTPMLYDVLALQTLYGVNTSTRGGDTVYFGASAGATYALADNDAMILTVWDGGGKDTFDGSNQTRAVKIDLGAGHYSSIGSIADNVAIAFNCTIENANGGRGNDTLTGNAVANVISGGAGNDLIDGLGAFDTASYATAAAGVSVSLMVTTAQVTGGAGTDTLRSIEGLTGSAFADKLTGNGFSNILNAGSGADSVYGGIGYDTIDGGAGADRLFGQAGNDVLRGGDGNDYLDGGAGLDRLYGGAGRDMFMLVTAPSAATNLDVIADFSVADDTILIGHGAFAAAGLVGGLAPGRLRLGSAAGDANDIFIYQASTGALFYDADGNGAAAQTRIATLSPNLALTVHDFVIV